MGTTLPTFADCLKTFLPVPKSTSFYPIAAAAGDPGRPWSLEQVTGTLTTASAWQIHSATDSEVCQ
jgi:hypothetical protein